MYGADFMWTLNRNKKGVTKDVLIGNISWWSNISKDLKQDLLKLRKSARLFQEFIRPSVRGTIDARKEERSTQTCSSFFAGSSTVRLELHNLNLSRPEEEGKSLRTKRMISALKPVIKRARELSPKWTIPRRSGANRTKGSRNHGRKRRTKNAPPTRA